MAAADAGSGSTVEDWAQVRARLLAFVSSRVGSRADAEDVVQNVLLRMARDLDALRDGERLDAWAYQIARSAIADEYRRRGRHAAAVDRLQAERGSAERGQLGEDPTAERVVESDLVELSGCLRPLIERLGEPYRSALTATAVQGRTQAEAAAAAGVSLSGMKSRVQRGRGRLREMLVACCTVDVSDPALRGRPVGDRCRCS